MKLRLGKYGLLDNPVGGHCTLKWEDRTLLGEVVSVYRNEIRGITHLRVKHFNGEMWPLEPAATAVDMLERD